MSRLVPNLGNTTTTHLNAMKLYQNQTCITPAINPQYVERALFVYCGSSQSSSLNEMSIMSIAIIVYQKGLGGLCQKLDPVSRPERCSLRLCGKKDRTSTYVWSREGYIKHGVKVSTRVTFGRVQCLVIFYPRTVYVVYALSLASF